MAAATARVPRNKIVKGTRGSLLAAYSMPLPVTSGLLLPRGLGDAATDLFEGGSGFLVGMVLCIRAI
jgi:hypothetical protein